MLGRVKKAVSQVASARRTRAREQLIASLRGSKRHLSVNGDLIVSRPDLISIGDWVSFTGTVTLYGDGGIDIGNNVIFADSVLLLSRNHEYTAVDAVPYSTPYKLEGLTVGDDVAFGMRVIVCPGVKIGTHALIGAGAVVTSNVPDHAIMMGNPARPAGKRDAEAYAFTKAHGRPLGQIRAGRLFDRKGALEAVQQTLAAALQRHGVVFESVAALDRFGEFRVSALYAFAMAQPTSLFCLTKKGYAVFDRDLVRCSLSRFGEDGPEITPKSVRDSIGVNLSPRQLEELQRGIAKTPHALETFLALAQ